MRIKVKAATGGGAFEIHHVDADEAVDVDTFLNRLVMDRIIHVNGMHDFMLDGYKITDLKNKKLKTLFNSKGRLKLTSPQATLTLTLKESGPAAHEWLLDYSEFIKLAHYYYDVTHKVETRIQEGTVFFIQHDRNQVFVKYGRSHLEFHHMDSDFKAADMKILFKSRDELSKRELKWMRSISFPDRLPKNPVFEHPDIKTQEDVDGLSVLLHRVITIIGRFHRAAEPLKNSRTRYPAYVQVGDETSIGYVDKALLQNLK